MRRLQQTQCLPGKGLSVYLLVFVTLFVTGCAGYSKRTLSSGGCSGEERLASWYGKDFHGRKTSSGETYDMHGLSAAHRTLPFGTLLLVTECSRGRTVQVRVNDRGPFVGKRELDLSYGAAKALGIVTEGVARVNIQTVHAPDPSLTTSSPTDVVGTAATPVDKDRAGPFLVQVGAYEVMENALHAQARLTPEYSAYLETHETRARSVHRVRIGPFSSEEEAQAISDRVAAHTAGQDAFYPLVIRAP